jgi:FMN phosphatase YigB (HAD superfamily)
MRVAFIHYHLKPGGVTTVIRQQVEALRNIGGEALVITGSPPPSPFPAETVSVPGLGYTREETTSPPAENIARDIAATIEKVWPGGCDILHVHNPTLGKNNRILETLASLKNMGFRLLLQIHDFAEDGRPDFYLQAPYPRDCHYAVINSRDCHILQAAGLKEVGLHLLPNTITPIDAAPAAPTDEPYVLYPVRAIRRKNFGEALLLSLFFTSGRHLAVTLPPGSPVDVTAYGDWKRFVAGHGLPVRFEAGLHADFSELVSHADFMITTSITEGFGFSFLEPWTAGKSLWGRKLPDICSDFEAGGLWLENLYSALWVPTSWYDHPAYVAEWRETVATACRKFACKTSPEAISAAESRLAENSRIDFGLLNEKFQRKILERLVKKPAEREELRILNPFLATLPECTGTQDRIERNREIVLSNYSAEIYQETLKRIYKRVLCDDVCHTIHKETLLSHFLNMEQMSLLKWGKYEQQAIGDRRQATGDRRQATGDRRQRTNNTTMEKAKTETTDLPDAILKELLTTGLRPMEPMMTNAMPEGSLHTPLKCVLFDIYGTLLISGSGDIGIARQSSRPSQRFQELLDRYEIPIAPEEVLTSFFNEIDGAHRRAKQEGVDFPEVVIERIWAGVIGTGDTLPAKRFALEFELMANPVWPMPHLNTLLEACRNAALPMGIISNAQFYTPLLLEWFLQGTLPECGFRKDLLFFSYKIGVAKPSPRLFEMAVRKLRKVDIEPDTVLYIGNDMGKDILPAKQAGFQTALFAGDARSLRLGENSECRDAHPDLVITELRQLLPYVDGRLKVES